MSDKLSALLGELGKVKHLRLDAPEEPPPGCWTDREGRFVKVDRIEPYESLREETIRPLVEGYLALYLGMADLKARLIDEIEALVATVWDLHGVKLEGKKKNATFYLYDGSFKIERNFNELTVYNEKFEVAEELIREFLDGMTESLDDEVKRFILAAFERNDKREIRRAEIIRLRRHNFDDPKWQQAMGIIRDAEEIVDSKCYFTVSVRDADGQYQPLPLSLSNVRACRLEKA